MVAATAEPPVRQAYSRTTALEKLRTLSARRDVMLYVLVRRNPALERALLYYFGTLSRAKQAAGLDRRAAAKESRWSVARIVRELQRAHTKGVRLTERDLIAAGHRALIGAIERFIGGLPEARRIAKVPEPPALPKKFTRWDISRVVDEILELHARGEPLNSKAAPQALVIAGIRQCGSWQAAIEAAGLDYESVRQMRPPRTDDELIADLRRLAREHPDWTRVDLGTLSIANSLERAFGTVDAGLRAAKLHDWPKRLGGPMLTEPELMKLLRQRKKSGGAMNSFAVYREDPRIHYAATQLFGTWDDALKAAGVPASRKIAARRSREQVVAELLERFRHGRALSQAVMVKEDPSLYHAAYRRFGTFKAAVRAMHRARKRATS